MNHLTDAEKALAQQYPSEFRKALIDGLTAVYATKANFTPEERADGGPGNAFQHAYWNALMSESIGPDLAEKFATAHENYGPGWVPDADNKMDLYNNQAGRDLAASYNPWTGGNLINHVMNALIVKLNAVPVRREFVHYGRNGVVESVDPRMISPGAGNNSEK